MDDSRFETLLQSEEGPALDFKSRQYRFTKADESARAELLKDILAHTNSWRTDTAYILIGVQEIKGSRSNPIGLAVDADDIDDASLQQFVSSKTNRPVDFTYGVYQFEGKRLGVIAIPKQARPIWLNADYGPLRRNAVYYRSGSSTSEATPDMIAKMMQTDIGVVLSDPAIEVNWFDDVSRNTLGTSREMKCVVHAEPDDKWPSAIRRVPIGDGKYAIANPIANERYWAELANYLWAKAAPHPLNLSITNMSNRLAENVRLLIKLPKHAALVVPPSDIPDVPSPELLYAIPRIPNMPGSSEPVISDTGDQWEVEVEIGSIQPKARAVTPEPTYVASMESQTITLAVVVYADNIGEPQSSRLTLEVDVEHRPALTMEDLRAFDN